MAGSNGLLTYGRTHVLQVAEHEDHVCNVCGLDEALESAVQLGDKVVSSLVVDVSTWVWPRWCSWV